MIIFSAFRVTVLASLVAVVSAAKKPTIIADTFAEGAHDRAVVVPMSDFRRPVLEAMGREFERTNRGYRFARLWIGTNKRSLEQLRAPRVTDQRYEDLIRGYESAKKDIDLAEVVCFAGSAVLRYRSSESPVATVVLRGRDVLNRTLDGVPVSILYMSVQERMRLVGETFQGGRVLRMFIMAGTKDRKLLNRIARIMQSEIGLRNLEINISWYPWFPYEEYYPAWNPFSQSNPPPRDRQIGRKDQVYCMPKGNGLKCDE